MRRELTQQSRKGDALALYADALFGKGEHKRARSYYRRAIERRRGAGPWQGDGTEQGPARGERAYDCGRPSAASCWMNRPRRLGRSKLFPWNCDPRKPRRCFRKLYLQSGLKRNAITAFESALDKDPLCLEVVEALQRLKASQQDFEGGRRHGFYQ